MKTRLFLFVFLAVVLLPLCLFAESAKIIDLSGQILVKKEVSGEWGKAGLNMLLNKGAELETKQDAYCTLAFDRERKNIVTIKQNSMVKIESVEPGNVSLREGRVFALIKNLANNEKFEIKTPTAVAGARGTGWTVQYHNLTTTIACFNDKIYLQLLNQAGEAIKEVVIDHGTGALVDPKGILSQLSSLTGEDYQEWEDFSGYISDLINSIDNKNPAIILIQAWGNGHYVVANGYDNKNKKVFYYDPFDGKTKPIRYENLDKRWHGLDRFERDHLGIFFK